MRALFFDSETTGLPLFNNPSEDPRQPHLVQLAAKLVDTDTRKVHASIDLIIEPKDWSISEEVSAIHGITHLLACQVGVPEEVALEALLRLWDCCDVRVAHNATFDSRIVRIAMKRYASNHRLQGYDADEWKLGEEQCTARLATPIMKLPPTPKMIAAKRNHPKTPNLGEAYQFFTGKPLENAHTALADVDACLAVWYAIKDRAAGGAIGQS